MTQVTYLKNAAAIDLMDGTAIGIESVWDEPTNLDKWFDDHELRPRYIILAANPKEIMEIVNDIVIERFDWR